MGFGAPAVSFILSYIFEYLFRLWDFF